MTCTPSPAESILRTTACDWGLAPGERPAEDSARNARSPGADDASRTSPRSDDRRRDAVHAE